MDAILRQLKNRGRDLSREQSKLQQDNQDIQKDSLRRGQAIGEAKDSIEVNTSALRDNERKLKENLTRLGEIDEQLRQLTEDLAQVNREA